MENKLSTIFKDSCAKEMVSISKKLGRDLTYDEKRAVLNTGSLVMLEGVMADFNYAKTPRDLRVAVEGLLASSHRLEIAVDELITMLDREFGVEISNGDRRMLLEKSHGLDILVLKEGVIDISKNEILMRKRKVRKYIEERLARIAKRGGKN